MMMTLGGAVGPMRYKTGNSCKRNVIHNSGTGDGDGCVGSDYD